MDGLGLKRPAAGLRIGLTGGIGSGKSTVAALLVGMGATLIDTDAIARQLTGPQGAALAAISDRFGPHFVNDRGLDRDAMRRLAFSEPEARRALERLLHPLILAQAEHEAARASTNLVVFDVPLLVESQHWRARVDRVLLIDCDDAVQRERVLRRPGWTAAALDGVMRAQTSRALRRAAADAVIDNSELTLDRLREELQSLLRHWVPMEESWP